MSDTAKTTAAERIAEGLRDAAEGRCVEHKTTEDDSDQALVPTDRCRRCRPEFVSGRQVYPPLIFQGRLWRCSACGISYGEHARG